MRPLRKTGRPSPTVFLLLGALTCTIAPISSHAEQPAEVPERESLRGLAGVEVFVEPFSIELEQLGLQPVHLQRDIKQRLQKAGVHVVTERERLTIPTAAVLRVRVAALHDRIGRYFYCLDLLLMQPVRLDDSRASALSAVTWMKQGGIGIVADDNVKHIEIQVLHQVDRFIKDYLAVNR